MNNPDGCLHVMTTLKYKIHNFFKRLSVLGVEVISLTEVDVIMRGVAVRRCCTEGSVQAYEMWWSL
jgi:hypothetical protein